MLSIQVLKSAKAAAEYYLEAVNYYQNDSMATQWFGRASQVLGLGDKIEKEQLLSLLNGELPNGQVLGKVKVNDKTGEKERQHRPGIDLTFSAPKSVSTLIGLNQTYSKSIEKFHDESVKWALSMVEQEFAVTRKKHMGLVQYVSTGNLAIAMHRHATSRANDPNIHTHCIVLNLTLDVNGKANSLASDIHGSRGFVESIGKNTVYIGALYRYKLAEKLIKSGFMLELTKDGLFEIAGFPKEILAEFSKRREEIMTFINEKGMTGPKARDFAALQTRVNKSEVPLDVLVKEWCGVVQELGYDPVSLTSMISERINQNIERPRLEVMLEKVYGFFLAKKRQLLS